MKNKTNNVFRTREIIINIPGGEFGNSSWKCFKIEGNEDIFWNSASIWAHSCIFELKCKIHKETPEGAKIFSMIDDNLPLKKIKKYIDSCVLKHLDVDTVYLLIDFIKRQEFKRGMSHRSKEFRKILEIYDEEDY